MLKVAWTSSYVLHLPKHHRFPMSKYDVLPEQLIYEGTIKQENIFNPTPLDEHWITRTHDAGYWEKLTRLELTPAEVRRTGFPMTPELI